MFENKIIKNMFKIAHHPFLIFVDRLEDRPDNSIKTLHLLAKEHEVTAGRISEFLDIKPSSVTQIIKKLEMIGTVEKTKSTKDARVSVIKLTEKGKQTVKEKSSVSNKLEEALFENFSKEELKAFNGYLEKLENTIASDAFNETLKKAFSDDKRWQKFDHMSTHFQRARSQMMEQGHDGDDRFHHFGPHFMERRFR